MSVTDPICESLCDLSDSPARCNLFCDIYANCPPTPSALYNLALDLGRDVAISDVLPIRSAITGTSIRILAFILVPIAIALIVLAAICTRNPTVTAAYTIGVILLFGLSALFLLWELERYLSQKIDSASAKIREALERNGNTAAWNYINKIKCIA